MVDVDEDLVQRLVATHERIASELNVQAASENPPVQEDTIARDGVREFLDSAAAETAGLQLGRAIGEGLVALFSNLVPSAEEREAARARAAAKISPPRPAVPVSAAPPPVPVAPAPAESKPVESGKPEMPGVTLGLPGLSFVGFVNDRPRAEGSNRFPTEPMAAHEQRLDINRTEPLSRPKMKGPIIGQQ